MAEEEGEYELKGELDELEAEFKEFEAEFGLAEEGLGPDELEAMSELENEMDLAGISEFEEGVGEEVSFASLGMDEPEVQAFVLGWIRKKVKRLIQKLIWLIRKYAKKCAKCAPLLVKTIRLYRRRKYFSALRQAYRTYRCIRRCVR